MSNKGRMSAAINILPRGIEEPVSVQATTGDGLATVDRGGDSSATGVTCAEAGGTPGD